MRPGFTLVEVLVALVLLGIGSALATRLMTQATREMEGAELGLRAALVLSELVAAGSGGPASVERPIGPGTLVAGGGDGMVFVRFEPAEGEAGSREWALPGMGGFGEEREWRLEPAP